MHFDAIEAGGQGVLRCFGIPFHEIKGISRACAALKLDTSLTAFSTSGSRLRVTFKFLTQEFALSRRQSD
jgi:hypothetical protein